MSGPARGASEMVSAFRLPPPQSGRRSNSSGRAVATTSSGTSVTQPTRSSMKSSSSSLAQWTSSNTSTVGRCSASASTKRRHAPKLSSRAPVSATQSDQRPQPLLDPDDVVLDHRCGHRLVKLALGVRGGVALQDARLGLDHVAEGPEGTALAVGERTPPAPVGQLRLVLELVEELSDQATLADARDAGDGHELGRGLVRARSNVESRSARSRSRPTSGVCGSPTSAPTRARASATSHTGTGAALPLTSTASRSR